MKNVIAIILTTFILCFSVFSQPLGKISYQSRKDLQIYIMDVASGKKIRLTDDIRRRLDVQASLSHDGSKIAFNVDLDDDKDKEIYVMDIGSRKRWRLTNNPWNEEHPWWSPDGEWIVFTADPPHKVGREFPAIYKIRVDGKYQERIIQNAKEPSWSPDGKWILFSRYGDICKIKLGTKLVVYITDDKFYYDHSPVFSPDGKKIAIISHRQDLQDQGVDKIYVIDADGTNRNKLTDSDSLYPCWSPDGEKIVFEAAIEEAIYTMEVADGNQKMLIRDARYPSWSPCRPFAIDPHDKRLMLWGALKYSMEE